MNPKEQLKHLMSVYNPLAIQRRSRMRQALHNTTASFLCPNCIGGILFHDLGLRFYSPTVNLMMNQTDFLKLVLDLDGYLAKEFVFFQHETYTCPCAKLGDITVCFTHYKTPEEAAQKWKERAKRIDRNNLFIFLEERDGLTHEDMLLLQNIHARGVLVFTAHAYSDIPYALHLPKYQSVGEVGNILTKSYWNDGREYETYFDFVKWFNEASGPNFDISPFKKRK